jgi:putative endonuclease
MRNRPSLKQLAEKHGRRSECLAAWYLRLKGYRILDTRVKTKLGEIDLVARAPFGPLCFIEVKARKDFAAAALAVGPRQAQRIARAAELYLARRPGLEKKGVRFDLVMMAGGVPRHLPDAWRSGG